MENNNIISFLNLFRKYKKPILTISGISAVVTFVVVFFIMDPIFYSSASVKITSKVGGLGSLLSGGIPDVGDLGDLTGVSSPSAKELALYENILNSRKCLEETIIKFDLMNEYDFKYMQDAVKNFREDILVLKKDKAASTLEIGVYNKDPKKAMDIVNFLIEQLNKINIELNVKNAASNRKFLEERYNQATKDLASSEDSLTFYQEQYGIAPDITVKAAVQAQIQLETELKSEEVKLDILSKILSPDQSEIKAQQDKIQALRKQLQGIENSDNTQTFLKLKGAPKLVMNFLRLQRTVEIQNKILSFLLPLYEQAKIEEKKEMPSVIVLDVANLPEKKAKPKRSIIILIAVAATFILAFTSFVLAEKWREIKNGQYQI